MKCNLVPAVLAHCRARSFRRARDVAEGTPLSNRVTSRQQQTQRTLLDWLRVEYTIDKPSNKLLTLADSIPTPG